jgi:hypothetical protein
VGRRVLDAAVGRLQVHIDDPFVQHLAERAQHDDGVPCGIVLVALQNITERSPGISVHQVVIHRALESFEFAFVPRNEDFCVLDIGADLEARTLEVAGMKLRGIVDHHEFRHAVGFPRILDGGKLALYIRFWKNRVLEAPHHRQAARWFKAHVKASGTSSVFIERGSEGGTSERQHRVIVHHNDVARRVIH